MQYGQIILRIGGFHLELAMHRAYVNLNWDINYSEIARFANFVSPKAQLVMHKVSDFHKSTDLFMASRSAKIREFLIPYVKDCQTRGKTPSQEDFSSWVDDEVTDKNYKLAIKIESVFGTAIWLSHAATRANNFALTDSAFTVFAPLFHIMGNCNYSIIELYDMHLKRKCRKVVPELAANLEQNEGTNFTNLPFCAQPNDARHEELNKVSLFSVYHRLS